MKQMSLRECAIDDARRKAGEPGVEELQKKFRIRKANKRKGIKTNVGDPNRKR